MGAESGAGQKQLVDLPDKVAKSQLHREQMLKISDERELLSNPEYLQSMSDLYEGYTGRKLNLDGGGKAATELLKNAREGFAIKEQRAGRLEQARLRAQPAKDAAAATADSVKEIADAIVSGDQPPDLKGLYKVGAPVRAELARRGFNLSTATQDWQATQKHLASLNGTQQTRLRQAVDATNEQLSNVERLYEEWRQAGATSGLKLFNRASLATAKQLPGAAGAAAQQLESQIALLTGELGNVLMGGNSPTDHALKLASQALNGEWNEQTFKSSIGNLRRDLQIRANSLKNATAAGLSPGNMYGAKPAPGVPEAPTAGPAKAAGPVKITNEAEYDALPSGAEYFAPDGKLRKKK
jgi:hypothetical protein